VHAGVRISTHNPFANTSISVSFRWTQLEEPWLLPARKPGGTDRAPFFLARGATQGPRPRTSRRARRRQSTWRWPRPSTPHFHVDAHRWAQRLNSHSETPNRYEPNPNDHSRIHVVTATGRSVLLSLRASSVGHVSSNIRLCRSPVSAGLQVTPDISCTGS